MYGYHCLVDYLQVLYETVSSVQNGVLQGELVGTKSPCCKNLDIGCLASGPNENCF